MGAAHVSGGGFCGRFLPGDQIGHKGSLVSSVSPFSFLLPFSLLLTKRIRFPPFSFLPFPGAVVQGRLFSNWLVGLRGVWLHATPFMIDAVRQRPFAIVFLADTFRCPRLSLYYA